MWKLGTGSIGTIYRPIQTRGPLTLVREICAAYIVCASCSKGPFIVFCLDRKNCENVSDKPEDLTPNMTSFVWTPELGAKVKEMAVKNSSYS